MIKSFTADKFQFEKSETGHPTRAILIAIAIVGLNIIGAEVLIRGLLSVQAAFGYQENFVVTYVIGGLMTLALMGAIAFGYIRFWTITIPLRMPSRRELGWILGGFIALLVVNIFVSVIGAALSMMFGLAGAEPAVPIAQRAASQNPVVAYGFLFIASFLLIGPIEELFYRGVVQGSLRESMGPVVAIGLTSLLFGVSHIGTYIIGGSNPFSIQAAVAILSIIGGAVVLGTFYEWTENLTVPILMHGSFNGVTALLFLGGLL